VANADHPFQDSSSLNPEVERVTFFADGEFDITDDTSAYTARCCSTVARPRPMATASSGPISIRPISISTLLSRASAAVPLSEGWGGAVWLSPTPITDHADDEITVDYQRFVAGLRG
jgi:iron complex outermembrane recepter protein